MIRRMAAAAAWRWDKYVAHHAKKLVFEANVLQAAATDAPAIRFHEGSEADLLRLAEQQAGGYDAESVAFCSARLRAGDRLGIGTVGGQYAISAWTMLGAMDLAMNDMIPLGPRDAYSYKVYTDAKFRGRGFAAAYYTFRKEQLRAAGYERLFCWIHARNLASIRAHERASFRQVAAFHEFRLLRSQPRFVFDRRFREKFLRAAESRR